MKVELLKYESLNEANGNKVQWSFVNFDEKQNAWIGLHSPFVCKDYLQDMFWSELEKKGEYSIYGFKYKDQIKSMIENQENYFLCIRLQKGTTKTGPFINLKDKETNLLEFVNFFTRNPSIFSKSFELKGSLDDSEEQLVLKVKRTVFKNPLYISLFTFLVRVGLLYDKSVEQMEFLKKCELFSNDAGYRSAALLALEKFSDNYMPIKNYNDYDSVSNVHNNSGIVAAQRDPDSFYKKSEEIKYSDLSSTISARSKHLYEQLSKVKSKAIPKAKASKISEETSDPFFQKEIMDIDQLYKKTKEEIKEQIKEQIKVATKDSKTSSDEDITF